jgi:hypothetical protein
VLLHNEYYDLVSNIHCGPTTLLKSLTLNVDWEEIFTDIILSISALIRYLGKEAIGDELYYAGYLNTIIPLSKATILT